MVDALQYPQLDFQNIVNDSTLLNTVASDTRLGIQSVEKAFEVLNALADGKGPCRLTDLAARSGMAPNLLRAYLVSLQRVGAVQQLERSGSYSLGEGALRLGLSAISKLDLMVFAREEATNLCARINEPVSVSVWTNRGPIVVHNVETEKSLPYEIKIGSLVACTTTAAGRCFIAFLPEGRWRALVTRERADMKRAGITEAALARNLGQIRKTGLSTRSFVLAGPEGLEGLHIGVLAAPVLNHTGDIKAVLTVISQGKHLDLSKEGGMGQHLVDAANRISHRLGYETSRAA